MANPGWTFCVNHGGTFHIKTGPAGQYGMCTFSNGSQCDEWQFFRGECSPTQTILNGTLTKTNSTSMTMPLSNSTSTNSTSTNSTSMHGTMVNPNTTNGTITVTNSTFR